MRRGAEYRIQGPSVGPEEVAIRVPAPHGTTLQRGDFGAAVDPLLPPQEPGPGWT